MLDRVKSGAVVGVDGLVIQVEVDLALGLPGFSTVGLAEGAVREAKDRVRAAIRNAGYEYPARRITVNLAPAAVRKEGSGYDLPMAVGILAAAGLIDPDRLSGVALAGELSLDGRVRPVPGVLAMAQALAADGVRTFLVPAGNSAEAAVAGGLDVIALERLDEAVEFLTGHWHPEPVRVDLKELFGRSEEGRVDFADVRGQDHVKRALEVAAAGGHNLLMAGVPGTGKTMMARRLPTILPDLSLDEALETTRVFSVSGLLEPETSLLVNRPFRSPHHTISDAGLIGGGHVPRPGEVSLAHNGVLFLDELPEFRKNVLEVMRQPLEDGHVTIARAASTLRFPARFMLVAAMNPCPCGHHGDPVHECRCTPVQIQRYRGRLSGPLLDRIDMHIHVPPVRVADLKTLAPGEKSAAIRDRVNRARAIQSDRFGKMEGIFCNAHMTAAMVRSLCPLDPEAAGLLDRAVDSLGLSARAYHRIIKIARTVADLAGAETIDSAHLAEAIQYRRMRFD